MRGKGRKGGLNRKVKSKSRRVKNDVKRERPKRSGRSMRGKP